MRGFYGIAVYHPKTPVNVGTLWRTANIFGASFLAVIGKRYTHQTSDTMKSWRHVPLYHYATFEDFKENGLPHSCKLVGVELDERASLLDSYSHPERAVYMLGAEDHGIPPHILAQCHSVVRMRGEHSMNLAVAGSILIYHRTSRL